MPSRGVDNQKHMDAKLGTTVQVLVVSRESTVLRPFFSMGEENSWDVESASSGWGAIERVGSGTTPDLLVLDMPRGDTDGLHFLRWLRRLRPQLPIILVCEPDDAPKKQEAIRLGARDCLFRPLNGPTIKRVMRRHLSSDGDPSETNITSDDVEPLGGEDFFVGASLVMRKLRAQAESLAASDGPVLILGEGGSGKQTAARLIHQLSVRSGFEFAAVNCAALPGDLLENELFGHSRNGSEGTPSKPGKLEFCEKGTILLDEITEMPLPLQATLLQVLRRRQFLRPGTGIPVEVNVRVLASSTSNVDRAISEKKLRQDLYYCLSAYTIHVPPLRERREEVPLLLHYFMRRLAKHYGLSARSFAAAVLEACQSHSWPGNLREMETFVKRYLMAEEKDGAFDSKTEPAGPGQTENLMLPSPTSPLPSAELPSLGISDGDSLKSLVQTAKLETERNAIAAALSATGWNRKAASRLLKVSYRTLLYKIDQYQMTSAETALCQTGAGRKSNGNGFGK